MREEIANLVHPVFMYGVRLQERLQKGERLDLDTEQAALKALLLTEMESRRYSDFGGEAGQDGSIAFPSRTELARRGTDSFLGIRYALVCWLDEIFILDSPWGRLWNEHKLETALYGTNLRAEWFWQQARLAESRTGTDALEVFFLCVMLGFRGELREEPAKLQQWVLNTQARVVRQQGQEWPAPPEHDPPTNVPPRHGRERFERMVLLVAVAILVLIPVLTIFMTNLFLKQ
ncbi:MAG: DotU family type IV/VI secretion system protein [Planctomycetota bacterium]|nr:MAG: DotU family type IV/VI secretion system protein [Planctomycetota bacterium]